MIGETLLIIVAGVLVGYWLSRQYSDHADTLQSAVSLAFASLWVAAAVVTIVTGYYAAGALLLVGFSYVWFSNFRQVRESDLRQKTSSWNPFGYEQQ